MKLGIDFDGTIADVTEAKIRYAREQLGHEITALETSHPLGLQRLGEEHYTTMVEAVHATEWTLTMRPMPGAIESLQLLAERHELYVVTARNDAEIGWAREWLEPHALPFREVVHTSRETKAAACEELGVELMLDDHLYVMRQLDECDVHLALIDAPYNREGELPRRTRRVTGWADFVTHAEELHGRTGREAPAAPPA